MTLPVAVGFDVGAGRVFGVALTGHRVQAWSVFDRPGTAAAWAADACPHRVAVDAPGSCSTGAHRDDLAVAPKFRSGRCSEVPVRGVPPVSWVTPSSVERCPGWMLTGFGLWQALDGAGLAVVETYPAANFHRLNGGRWPPSKSTSPGRARRLELLSALIDLPAAAAGWSHDLLDAAVCAVAADRGGPVEHRCARPDGSAMWIV